LNKSSELAFMFPEPILVMLMLLLFSSRLAAMAVANPRKKIGSGLLLQLCGTSDNLLQNSWVLLVVAASLLLPPLWS
jgi:uncharacterized protein YcgL (UPF0745 family)